LKSVHQIVDVGHRQAILHVSPRKKTQGHPVIWLAKRWIGTPKASGWEMLSKKWHTINLQCGGAVFVVYLPGNEERSFGREHDLLQEFVVLVKFSSVVTAN
jgi:hypothetical protein